MFNNYKCKGCGKCCIDLSVSLNKDDLNKIKKDFYYNIGTRYYLKQIKYNGHKYCIFLDPKTLTCTNYKNRPQVCKNVKTFSDYCVNYHNRKIFMENSGINYPYIKSFTIDPNEYCNAKCWWCPNGYRNQKENIMSIENIEIIIDKILSEKGNIVDPDLDTMYFHHFNEIILYPYFKELLELLRSKKLETHIFSNGVELTPEKYNLLLEYKDVVKGLKLNVSSIERETWKNNMRMSDNDFYKLIYNLNYIKKNKNNLNVSVEVNGINKESYFENGGNMAKMKNFPKNIKDDLDYHFELVKKEYHEFDYFLKFNKLVDWSGYLEEKNIYSNYLRNLLNNKKDNTKIVDCNCFNRTYNYLEINSKGDVYFCLDDVNFKTVYGNLLKQDLSEIWNSEKRKKILKQQTTNGMCTKCEAAVWKK